MRSVFTLVLIATAALAFAQQSTTAVQQVDLSLTNIIRIRFANNNSQTGNLVDIPLNNVGDLLNGVTSTNQNLAVASTKPFNVNVKASSNAFSYTGGTQVNTQMQVDDVLKLKVNLNNTGGTVGSGFTSFKPITDSEQNLINGGDNGVNKVFRIRYKAKPGMGYAGGNYLTSVIYTATQQ